MSGIFGALNTANKGLMASQTALHTTGHNLSNTNTDGYSRQRVDMKADLSFHYAGVGQLGTGVKMEAVVRMVDEYVTRQIREENGTFQRFSSKAEVLQQLEIIFNEPSDTSLNFNIGEMFDAWQELSKNPELPTSKRIVVEKSITLADTFNRIITQIGSLEDESEGLIGQNVKELNANIDKLETLNKQIFNIAVKGQIPNDLLDQRDLLLKDMSSITNFEVKEDNYGRVSIGIGGTGEGSEKWNILEAGKSKNKLEFVADDLDEDGDSIGPNIKIVSIDEDGDEVRTPIINFINTGEIKGRFEALEDLAARKDELMKFGETLAAAVNKVHGDIEIKDEDGNVIDTIEFFNYVDGRLTVSEELDKDSSLINAGADPDGNSPEGDGSRALALSSLRNVKLDFSGESEFIINGLELEDQPGGNTIGGYYNQIITDVGISKEHADNTVANQNILLGQLELRRESTSGVNIDEEVTNLIKFNSAYAANARVISTLTEMLDTLIRMGA